MVSFVLKYGIWAVNLMSALLIIDFFQYMKGQPIYKSVNDYTLILLAVNACYAIFTWPEKKVIPSKVSHPAKEHQKKQTAVPPVVRRLDPVAPPIPKPAPVLSSVAPPAPIAPTPIAPTPIAPAPIAPAPVAPPPPVDPLTSARTDLLNILNMRAKNLKAEEDLQISFQMPFLNSWAKLSRWHDLGMRIGLQILDWLQSGGTQSLALLIDGNSGTGKTEASQSLLGAKGTPALQLPGFVGEILRFNSSNIKDFESKVAALEKRSVILIDEINLLVESSPRAVFNDSTRPQFLSQLQHFIEHTQHIWIFFGDFQATRGNQSLSDKSMKNLFGSTLGELIHHWQLNVPSWNLESLVDAILESNLVAADGSPFEPSKAEGFSLGYLAKTCIESGGGYRECEKHIKNLIIQWKKDGKRGYITLEQVQAYLNAVMRDAA